MIETLLSTKKNSQKLLGRTYFKVRTKKSKLHLHQILIGRSSNVLNSPSIGSAQRNSLKIREIDLDTNFVLH